MGKKKRPPAYNAEDAALLKSAGIPHKVKQPFGTVPAVRKVNEAQRGRITHVSTQERVVKGSEGRIDTCRAAVVQQVHSALGQVTPRAQSGWLDYAELWDAAQPSQSVDYGDRAERIAQGRDADADPAWLKARTRLRLFEQGLDTRVVRQADRFMQVRETLAVNAMVLAMMEGVGKALAKAFENE